jgi:hypothetical protein
VEFDMNSKLQAATIVMVASAVAMMWGFQYRGDHPMAAVGALFGAQDPTYTLAGWASGLGILAFLVGIALFIAGLVQSSSSSSGGKE